MQHDSDMPVGARPLEQQPAASPPRGEFEDASLGELFGRFSEDLSILMRQEVDLAKAEFRQEVTKASKGAGLLGGTGLAAIFGLLMLSFAAAWGLAEVMAVGWAFVVVAAIYLVTAATLFVNGRRELRSVHPVPEKTVQTLKEDAQWAKHPTS